MLKANPMVKKLETTKITKKAQRAQRKIYFIENNLRAL